MKASTILLTATFVLPAVVAQGEDFPGYFISASYCASFFACQNPTSVQIYTTDLINAKDADTLKSAVASSQSGDAALARQIADVQSNLKQQLAEGLDKIPKTLFSDDAKAKMIEDLSAKIAAQN
ncbi:hypothetical protein [Rhizobium leguminosarum]|uniref:hypothetical protein n=1 Tax=Rhizobium leguminosarum TaxID=384 RepID=UPI00103127BB|nr:hypothetical protein [Rhizobium leguminosarum]TBF82675.1 hypothetical protein ELG86_11325 [Rhizobium leguminosarum]TBH02159.1 hypothetical protein ELG70_11290 [Rhizobium leguminosarum]TBH36617.1 hypothetical protein ELG66_12620 [Rhizobium leguminosarum]TBH41819.1 hypothetical protein ELG63_10830 [Rhizobium leguminosarum]TBH66845.1 hypothetical protein ELG61_11025 [Rhizobium leguminosarum]